MPFVKTVFDHTLITSEFLNELQDYVISLENRPQLCLYEETGGNIIPNSGTASLSVSGLLINRTPVVGDILLGTQTLSYARVTVSGTETFTVTGLGHL